MAEQRKQAELAALLGAYLDNELSNAQVDKVEKLLEQSESARKLLSQLELSRESLRSLPRERAPESLTAGIERELERDLLLGGNDALVESVGHKHLILRRVTAAAAVLVLCGTIATIVYQVLFSHNGHPISVDESVVVLNTPSASPPMGSPEVAKDGVLSDSPQNLRRPDDLTAVSARRDPVSHFSKPVPAPQDVALPIYRPVHLVYRSIKADTTLMQLRKLCQNMVFAPVTRQLSDQQVRYVFMCSPDQLRDFLSEIEDDLSGELALRLSRGEGIDVDEPEVLTLSGVTTEQVLALAGRRDAQTQWQDVKAMIAAAEPDDPQTMITTSDAVAVAAAKIDSADSAASAKDKVDDITIDAVDAVAANSIDSATGAGAGHIDRVVSGAESDAADGIKDVRAADAGTKANRADDTVSTVRSANVADTTMARVADRDNRVVSELKASRSTMLGEPTMKKTSARAAAGSQGIMANTAEGEAGMAEAVGSGGAAGAGQSAYRDGNANNRVMGPQRHNGGISVEPSSVLNDDGDSEASSAPDLIAVIFDLWVPAEKDDTSADDAVEDVNAVNDAVSSESVNQPVPAAPAPAVDPEKEAATSGKP